MKIRHGMILEKGTRRVRVVGVRGKTTLLVVAHPTPISSRTETYGIRITTIERDWTEVPESTGDKP